MTARKKAEEAMKNIRQAIMEVSKEVKPLAKTDSNQYANYNYVSIDQYYDHVRSIALKHGLWWRIREVAYETGGKSATFTYEVDVFTEDDIWESYDLLHLTHPYNGAQTAGSARSYAEKVFMRSAFKMVTGEPDADFLNPKAAGESVEVKTPASIKDTGPEKEQIDKPVQVEENIEEIKERIVEKTDGGPPKFITPSEDEEGGWPWSGVSQIMTMFVDDARNKEELVALWKENSDTLDKLQYHAPKLYTKTKTYFTKRRRELSGKEE